MNIKLRKQDNNYIMKISYEVNETVEKAFELIATNEGFLRWFPELKIETLNGEDVLVFEMSNFREEMKILSFKKDKEISYEWDSASVKFNLLRDGEYTFVEFEEIIPVDFGNEFSNAIKDMTGWCMQNNSIMNVLNNENLQKDREDLKSEYLEYIKILTNK